MRFEIVLNPAGASGLAWKTWRRLERVITKDGCAYTVHRSTPEHGVAEICRELTLRGEPVSLIVIGGDGTSNEALNGIADFDNTAVGFIPCGTGNDLHRDMGIPNSTVKLLKTMLDGTVKRTADIGELKCTANGKRIVRRFNISCDIGFGAATCAYVNRSRIKPILNKLGIGRAIYLIEALRVCFTSEPQPVAVTCGGRTRLYRRCLCVIAMNHCHEGGGFDFCPDARFDDGKLDLCIGNGLSHGGFLHMLPLAYMGRHMKLRGIYGDRGESVKLRTNKPIWIHTDGEALGKTTSAEIRIIDEKLRLLF